MEGEIEFDSQGLGGSTPLLLWAPAGFEEALGYDQGLRLVAFHWDPEWDDLAINDGFRQSIGPQWRDAEGAEGDAWDDWRGQMMVENVLAAYNLGDSGSAPEHWLILDRKTRQFSIAPAGRAAAFLREANEPLSAPEPAQADSATSPYPSEALPKRRWDEYTI